MRTKVAAFSRLEFLCNQEKSLIFKKGKADRRSKHAFHYFLKKQIFHITVQCIHTLVTQNWEIPLYIHLRMVSQDPTERNEFDSILLPKNIKRILENFGQNGYTLVDTFLKVCIEQEIWKKISLSLAMFLSFFSRLREKPEKNIFTKIMILDLKSCCDLIGIHVLKIKQTN